jgi:hypothetical protein
MTKAEDWKLFCSKAANIMRQALANEITLDDASMFFEKSTYPADQGLRQYMQRAIWEIDGNRNYYMELQQLFEKGASESDLLDYINT